MVAGGAALASSTDAEEMEAVIDAAEEGDNPQVDEEDTENLETEDTSAMLVGTSTSDESSEIIIALPPGKLGIKFNGSPAQISEVAEDSPIAGQVEVGKYVLKFIIPGNVDVSGKSSMKLAEALREHSNWDTRTLVLVDKPDGIGISTFVLPAGALGMTFKGEKATIKVIKDSSPLAGKVQHGSRVTKLVVPDQSFEVSDPSSKELGECLRKFSDLDTRTITVDEGPFMTEEVVFKPPDEPVAKVEEPIAVVAEPVEVVEAPKSMRRLFFDLGSVDLETVHQASQALIDMNIAGAAKQSEAKKLIDKGVAPCALTALRNHSDNLEVVTNCIAVLGQLSLVGNPEFGQSITNLVGSNLIIQAMKDFPDDEALQTHALTVLVSLSSHSRASSESVVDNDGVKSCVAAMTTFPSDEKIQLRGCKVLYNISVQAKKWAAVVRAEKGLSVLSLLVESNEGQLGKDAQKAMMVHLE